MIISLVMMMSPPRPSPSPKMWTWVQLELDVSGGRWLPVLACGSCRHRSDMATAGGAESPRTSRSVPRGSSWGGTLDGGRGPAVPRLVGAVQSPPFERLYTHHRQATAAVLAGHGYWVTGEMSHYSETGVFPSLDRVSGTLCLLHYVTETSHLYSLRDFWRHFCLSRAASHGDCCFFAPCTNIITYLHTYM